MTFRKSVLLSFLFWSVVFVENINGKELDFKTHYLRLAHGESYMCKLVRSQQEMENLLKKAGSSDDKISEVDVDWSKNITLLVAREKMIPVKLFHSGENRVRLRYKSVKYEIPKSNPDSVSITEGLHSPPRWALLVEFSRLVDHTEYDCMGPRRAWAILD